MLYVRINIRIAVVDALRLVRPFLLVGGRKCVPGFFHPGLQDSSVLFTVQILLLSFNQHLRVELLSYTGEVKRTSGHLPSSKQGGWTLLVTTAAAHHRERLSRRRNSQFALAEQCEYALAALCRHGVFARSKFCEKRLWVTR